MAGSHHERQEDHVDVFIPQRGYMRIPFLSWLNLGISAREGFRKAEKLFGSDGKASEEAAVERARRGAVLHGDHGAYWDDGE